ncbi:hypothetical protein VTK26DRAFT_2403 [Humicola hyalothermophila]
MAVMTTQQSEGALPSAKPLQATVSLETDEKEGPNGHVEMNGHNSPPAPHSDAKTELVANVKSDQNENSSTQPEKPLSNETKEETRPTTAEGMTEEKSVGGAAGEKVGETNQVKTEDVAAQADTDMPDAPTGPVPERKMPEPTSPKSQPPPQPERKPADQNGPTTDAADLLVSPSKNDSLPPKPVPDSSVTDTEKEEANEDVAMAESQGEGEPGTATDAAESTRHTALSDTSPTRPGGDAKPEGADSRTDAHDASKGTPPPAATADTSMSEPTQASTKMSREERDIDSEDEPVAKRAKVQHTGDQVEVKTTPPQDRMDVDQKPGADAGPLYLANGEPKNLSDESLNDQPITEWQAKQIRAVLAGVKKTKVGAGFRQPVRDLWPQLWNDYSARVKNPIDITTMEKRLRGDGPPYATMGDFKADLDLMVQNSVTFNGEVHEVTQAARACRESILSRMAAFPAVPPAKPEKKEGAKSHPTRHAEPRTAATPAAARPPKASPTTQKAVVESPTFPIPPNNNGMPLIRRDSTKPDSRAKRPVKPAHPKDLVYDTKRKKKLPLELRFCDEVLTELRKTKNYEINAAFMQPVDPVALNIPTYHKIIKKPMDLGTMAQKLGAGEYTSAKEFEKDFDLIIKNCRTFNGEDHLVYHQALRLQDLYRAEMSRKDEWMAKHAPVSTSSHAAASPHLRGDSEDEDVESEPDEHEEERKQSQHRLATIQKRLEDEQRKINEMVNSGTTEIAEVEIAQSVVAMLQKQLIQERAKMASLPAKKPSKKSKKKSGGAAIGKKAALAGGAGRAANKGGNKKAAPKRKPTQAEKEVVSNYLGALEGPNLERAIDLIKRDTGQGENDSGELELDIDSLSDDALMRLYDIVVKAFPEARIESKDKAPASDPPAAAARPKPAGKAKKNKPMSKSEQERRIQQLNELRAQAGRQASGSQEPIESADGNGNEPVAAHSAHESEDEVSSEEE